MNSTNSSFRRLTAADIREDVLLSVADLSVEAGTPARPLRIVSNLDFQIRHGEVVGIVGESGSGKSVTALALMGLLPATALRVTRGRLLLDGQDLRALTPREYAGIRGKRIGMIFQDPMSSLNPVLTIGAQLTEAILLHEHVGRRNAWSRGIELLEEMNIPDAPERMHDYPHHMSGGMRQRVMIAMALSCGPTLLIADEPTTALDVTIQAQILQLLRRLQKDRGMAMLLITHDFGVIAEVAQRVLVMYGGNIVEDAAVDELFELPLHPYTRGLLKSIPSAVGDEKELPAIEGAPPVAGAVIPGCRFNPRCPDRIAACVLAQPALAWVSDRRRVACWLHCSSSTDAV